MTCEQVVAPGAGHAWEQAAMVHAVALHHPHSSPGVKHTERGCSGYGLVATEAGTVSL